MELPTEQRYGYLIYILVVGSLGKYYPVLINYSTGEGSAIFSVINSPSDYSTTLNGNVLTLGISSGGVWNVYARAYKMI